MQKTVRTSKKVTLLGRITAAVLLGLLITYSTHPGVKTATAAANCNTIADCTNKINQGQAAVNSLKNQAVSYKDAITRLSSQISNVQGEISHNQSEQARLNAEIAKARQDILDQKAVLGEFVRTMYTDGQISQIEMLATSSKLSDYVDKETYRNEVTGQIQETMDRITKMQEQLESQQKQVASLLAQQQQQAASLSSAKSEQASMLNYNVSQQSEFNAQTAANQSKLGALIAAQRSANNTSKGGYYFIRIPGRVNDKRGSYPYANAGFSMSTAPGCNDNDGPDKWGYCTRQCVSYAAWAVEASGRPAPRYWGDAKRWPARARAAGIPVYNTPQRGDVAISMNGNWGHAMYVESVSGNNINVSQYNQQLSGQYSTQTRRWQ